MKKFILALLLCVSCLFGSVALAEDINISWDANTETNVTGYKLHYGTVEGVYTDTIDVGNVLSYVLPLNAGKYYITATAYDIDGNESAYTYALIYMVGLSKVTGMSVS